MSTVKASLRRRKQCSKLAKTALNIAIAREIMLGVGGGGGHAMVAANPSQDSSGAMAITATAVPTKKANRKKKPKTLFKLQLGLNVEQVVVGLTQKVHV